MKNELRTLPHRTIRPNCRVVFVGAPHLKLCILTYDLENLRLTSTNILPYFTYCNLIWSNDFESRLNKLVVLQKNAIRIIGKAEYLAHADPLFKQFGLLKMDDSSQQQTSVFVYKFIREEFPAIFANYFCPTTDFLLHKAVFRFPCFIC